MGPRGTAKTPILNQITPRNNTEDGKIQFQLDGSLESRTYKVAHHVKMSLKNILHSRPLLPLTGLTGEGGGGEMQHSETLLIAP
jgi:hypothetical protein